uniref:Uncharacterized protein n=1 Tax=Anguilla anguilla TaxID=7936 RepID=A0A0E9WVR7_ANGAN
MKAGFSGVMTLSFLSHSQKLGSKGTILPKSFSEGYIRRWGLPE